MHFGTPEILVPAHELVNGRFIRLVRPDHDVSPVHFCATAIRP